MMWQITTVSAEDICVPIYCKPVVRIQCVGLWYSCTDTHRNWIERVELHPKYESNGTRILTAHSLTW